ncbi:MAG: response regulator transcription factor [Sedimentisphaerales bacterium]|nr:response regulator transcription factor [Sedimentisphaerales bacterium]
MTENNQNRDFLSQPDVTLINEKQWLSIGRRYNMTTRELQVARLVCGGLSNEQISEKLSIRVGTVKAHVRNIYRRINVQNRIGILLEFLKFTFASVGCSQKTKQDIIAVDGEHKSHILRPDQMHKEK